VSVCERCVINKPEVLYIAAVVTSATLLHLCITWIHHKLIRSVTMVQIMASKTFVSIR